MSANGVELAAEWVTLLPETSKLVKFLKAFRPAPIMVEVEVDTDQMERDSKDAGRRAGRKVREEVGRETKHTGRIAGENIADGLNNRRVAQAAEATGRTIRHEIENETRKIKFNAIASALFSGFRGAASGTMQLIRNIGTIATVTRFAARAARSLSLSLLAGATAAQVLTGVGIGTLGKGLGFVSKQANRVATDIARVTSLVLVSVAAFKALSIMTTIAKWTGLLTIGMSALAGVAAALTVTIGKALYGAILSLGSAAGVAVGAIAGLLGPAVVVAKLVGKTLGDAAQEYNKKFAEADETFNKLIGERMGPLLDAFHSLKTEVTDTFTKAFQPAFGWLGDAIKNLTPWVSGLGTTLGNVGGEIAGTLASPQTQEALKKMFDASNRFFQSFLGESGLAGLTSGLIQFAATAADTFAGSGAKINELLLRAGEWLRSIGPAQMKAAFAAAETVIKNIWNIIQPIISGIRQLGEVAAPALAPGFKDLGAAIKESIPGLVNMTQILMPALSQVMTNLAPLLPSLVQAFTPWASTLAIIAPVIAQVVASLGPFAPLLVVAAGAVKAISAAILIGNAAMAAWAVAQGVAALATGAGTAALAGNTIALTAYRVAAVASTVASYALGAAITVATGPIGLIIAAVAAVGVALWAFFTKTDVGKKIWENVWNTIKAVAAAVWPALKAGFAAISQAAGAVWNWMKQQWDNVGYPMFQAIGQALTWLYQNIWLPTWEVIKTVAGLAWSVIKVIFEAFGAAIRILGGAIEWWWKNVTVPAFNAIKSVIGTVWEFVKPIWELWKGAFDKLIEGAGKFKDGLVEGFNKIKEVVKSVWDFIKPIIDSIKNGLDGVGNFLSNLNPFGNAGGGVVPPLPGFAGGHPAGRTSSGKLWGPGTGTSDSIFGVNGAGVPVVRVSAGEGIVKESAMQGGGAAVVAALNAGWVPSANFLHGMLPGFAEGLNPGANYLRDVIRRMWPQVTDIGGRRAEDGMGEHSSGNAIDIMIPNWQTPEGVALGNQIGAFLVKNAKALGLDGLIWQQRSYGYGGSFYSGTPMDDRGSPTQNHMDHLHAILGKGRGINAQAVGLPSMSLNTSGVSGAISNAGLPTSMKGSPSGSSGSGSYYEVDEKKVREAEDKVHDLKSDLAVAEQELTELEAKKNVKESTLQKKRDRIEELKRDIGQAETDLGTARQGKLKEGSKKSGDSSENPLDGKELGKMFFSGIMESLGFDGSLFGNILDTPNVKSVVAGVNAFSKPIQSLLGVGDYSESSSGYLGVGSGADPLGSIIGGIGDVAGVNSMTPGGANAGGAPEGAPDQAPVVDMRGAQLGWDPQHTMDKVEQFSAGKRRFTNLPGAGP